MQAPARDQLVKLLIAVVEQGQFAVSGAVHGTDVADLLQAHQRLMGAGDHVDVDHLHVLLDGYAQRLVVTVRQLQQPRVRHGLQTGVLADLIGQPADFISQAVALVVVFSSVAAADERVEKAHAGACVQSQLLADAAQAHRLLGCGQQFQNGQRLFR